MTNPDIETQRRSRETGGRRAEYAAAAALMLRGYRILGRRCRTRYGEIDLVAVRGRRIAFVEVKQRRTLVEAADALMPSQIERIQRAAEAWLDRHRRYRDHDIGLDAILVVPWRWPVHQRDVLQDGAMDWRLRPRRTRR